LLFRQQRGPFGRRGEIELETLLADILDEVPLVGELALVVPSKLVQDQPPRLAHTERLLEQIDQELRPMIESFLPEDRRETLCERV
jgi:hypothetical protein